MSFAVDSRILESSFWLHDLPLTSVFLKNDANFPWLILVPRVESIQEIYQLNKKDLKQFIEEISEVSKIVQDYFKADKLNVGALGNIVPQLHFHIVARFKEDKAWPHGIWQAGFISNKYDNERLDSLILHLKDKFAVRDSKK